ncbi:MAG: hypothetical protein HC908_16315 [Calothrix sp. SM1_7_51]|nr:hypothetical protein [Calothrix sp. SM1_7_51]
MKGKLLREPVYFIRQALVGIVIGLLMLLVLAQIQFPLWTIIVVSSIATGAIMPFLMKDFKMK